jgi:uncharacterized protein YjbJ (UPF0337 family)
MTRNVRRGLNESGAIGSHLIRFRIRCASAAHVTPSEETMSVTDRSGTGDQIKGTMEELKGEGKQALGDLTGDDKLKAEGVMDELKGKAERAMGDMKDMAEDLKDDIKREI